MHIDGINPGNGQALGLTKLHAKNQDDQGVPEPTANNITGDDTPAVQTADATTETTEEISGALRNLMDGHYKGVADIRLRINFQEEIAAIESAQRQAIADEQLAQILDSITGTGDDESPLEPATALVAESQDQTDEPAVTDLVGVTELQEALANDINAITESYPGTSASSDDLAENLWAAFNNYVDSMLELYPPPEEAPPEEPEPTPPPAPATEPEPELAPPPVLVAEPTSVAEPAAAPPPAPATEPEPELAPPPVLVAEPTPVAETETTPVAKLAPTPPPEPATETEPELAPPPVLVAEPTPVDEPAPVADPEPEPVPPPEPEPTPPPEPDPEPVPPPEPEPESTTDIQGYLDDLEAAFSTAIDELIEALSMVSVLPELSGPTGNGAAYQKFIAIYNELQNDGGAGTVDAIG